MDQSKDDNERIEFERKMVEMEKMKEFISSLNNEEKKMIYALADIAKKKNVFTLTPEEKLCLNIIHHILENQKDRDESYRFYSNFIKFLSTTL